jgi:phosphoglycolate phosphatase
VALARSWAWAFDQLYGVPADIGAHTSDGETDPQVGAKTFRGVLGREPSHDELARLYAKYLWHLSEDIWTSAAYRVLDGVEKLLTRLAEAGVILGVTSGAMEGAARTKLEPGKLNRYFTFGAYGSDSSDRIELTKRGIAKAGRIHGRDLSPQQVYVAGDTPGTSTPAAPPEPPLSGWPAATTPPTTCMPRWPITSCSP